MTLERLWTGHGLQEGNTERRMGLLKHLNKIMAVFMQNRLR